MVLAPEPDSGVSRGLAVDEVREPQAIVVVTRGIAAERVHEDVDVGKNHARPSSRTGSTNGSTAFRFPVRASLTRGTLWLDDADNPGRSRVRKGRVLGSCGRNRMD